MRIIPAIDIIDGKCVRLTQGDYAQKTIYGDNPLDAARKFEAVGLRYLHVVDLDGAKAGKISNWSTINDLAANTSLEIDFGGGIKTEDDLTRLFAAGVQQVNIGSIAIRDPDKVKGWIAKYGADRIILSADVRDEVIAVGGWQENSATMLFDVLSAYVASGIRYVTCTDIGTDGTLQGPNLALYKKIRLRFPSIRLIASGGVGSKDDLLSLRETGVDGVIIGKALYENKIALEELRTIDSGLC